MLLEYLSEYARYRSLARTGISHKAHMYARRLYALVLQGKRYLRNHLFYSFFELFDAYQIVKHLHTAPVVGLVGGERFYLALFDVGIVYGVFGVVELLYIEHLAYHFQYGTKFIELAVALFFPYTRAENLPRVIVHSEALLRDELLCVALYFICRKRHKC